LETTRAVIKAFKENGIDACWNYFDNNWHYIRKWDHLKELKSLFPITQEVKDGLKYLKTKSFKQSDHFIGRNISCLIKLSWTQEEVEERAKKMTEIISQIV
jgi:8-amino-3,8-dideoxy-alpha-D-manno-octulosonate transaminase